MNDSGKIYKSTKLPPEKLKAVQGTDVLEKAFTLNEVLPQQAQKLKLGNIVNLPPRHIMPEVSSMTRWFSSISVQKCSS